MTTSTKPAVPIIAGWFTMSDPPHLLGSKCRACGAVFFPKQLVYCQNPACSSIELDEIELGRTGRLWSYTNNAFAPPAPYPAPFPKGADFEPYAVAAVELDDERMVVLGQVVNGVGVDELRVGMPMELAVERFAEDDEHVYLSWKWRPMGARA